MYKLMIVDDEPWILKDMEQIIDWTSLGFELDTIARDADSAESAMKHRRIDVVISDIRMPGRDGLSLLASINRRSPKTFVIFMSAYSEFEYAKKALEQGCFSYLLKPVNASELKETLNRCKHRLDERHREQSTNYAFQDYMLFMELMERNRDVSENLKVLAERGFYPKRGGVNYVFVLINAEDEGKVSLVQYL